MIKQIKAVRPHTPIQYVMGKTKFFGLDFIVDGKVMIPRPETEILVYTVIDIIDGVKGPATKSLAGRQGLRVKIIDLGTGSGCIAISLVEALTKARTDCKMVASDISEKALEIARINAAAHAVSERIEFVKSDLFADIDGKFDIIVSNPPYVSKPEFATLQKEVLVEPRLALDGGDDGLDFYRKIIPAAKRYLNESGYLIFEIGYGQRKKIEKIFERTGGFRISKVMEDHNEIDRVVVARWTPQSDCGQ